MLYSPHNHWHRIVLCLTCSAHVYAADLVVTSVADSGPGSLRAAVEGATGGETIRFDRTLDNATIILTSGSLTIADLELTIDASILPSGISISGNNSSRVLRILGNASDVTLKHLTIRDGREAGTSGGGIAAVQGRLVMDNCIVQNCYALNNGGGMYLGSGIEAIFDRCSVIENECRDFGGGLYLLGTASTTLTNSVIAGNLCTTDNGGGICNQSNSPLIVNCSIQGNNGYGIRNFDGSAPTIRNSIVWGNRSGGANLAAAQLKNSGDTTFNVDFCLVEGASDSAGFSDGDRVAWGASNLNGLLVANEPQFNVVDVAANAPTASFDLRLKSGSTSIGVGDNLVNAMPLDLAGLPRTQSGTIDLGAYEGGYVSFATMHPGLSPTADENFNGISNFSEYAAGIDPEGPNDASARPVISKSLGLSSLTYSWRINGVDVTPQWETSSSLDVGSWQPLLAGLDYEIDSTLMLAPGRQQVILEVPDSGPQRFFRQGF